MRKFILILSVAIALALGFGVVRTAGVNAQGPHGGYNLSTDKCAACHRAHTAAGSFLLVKATTWELCTTCHGNGGLANTNVVAGAWEGTGPGQLHGGGFQQMTFSWDLLGNQTTPTLQNVNSVHNVDGLNGGNGQGTAWGSGSSGVGVSGTLECTSCHDPHGGGNNYRLIKGTSLSHSTGLVDPAARWVPSSPGILDNADFQVVALNGGPNEGCAYTEAAPVPTSTVTKGLNRIPACYTSGLQRLATPKPAGTPGVTLQNTLIWGDGTPYAAMAPTVNAVPGMTGFCGTCHRQYVTGSGSYSRPSNWTPIAGTATPSIPYYLYPGTQDALDAATPGPNDIPRYRHATYSTSGSSPSTGLRFASVELTPAANPANEDAPDNFFGRSCLTCHYSHGSAAQATGYAAGVAPAGDSALLFLNNRGVCQACHNK